MAKGALSKQEATQKILELFPGSFIYEKEIRIPFVEEGENIQLKCALTCAKTNVEVGGENALPGEDVPVATTSATTTPIEKTVVSDEEKENLRRMMEAIGI
jgi:hypothetical protein